MAFAESTADIVIYGGAAGGGKSYALLLEPLRHRRTRRFGAVVFRRTHPQIMAEGGLWDTACEIYPGLGGRMVQGNAEVRFHDPDDPRAFTKVTFRHLQHEIDKLAWQGSQIPLICFDELTHFTSGQFWYLVSRNRSTCGVRPYIRATTNPEAGSWVAELISWWIDPNTGFAIPERSGVVRYFIRPTGDALVWADSREELEQSHPDHVDGIKSFTFIAAKLSDNPALTSTDPGYLANLMALPRLERERLLGGNWLAREDSLVEIEWLKREFAFTTRPGQKWVQLIRGGDVREFNAASMRRFATIDTAGTSREKARDAQGKPPSYSAVAIWDYHRETDSLLLRRMWRKQVKWSELKSGTLGLLQEWGCRQAYVENAHFGPALAEELRAGQVTVTLVGPKIQGMRDSGAGPKLERATASGLLSRLEFGGFFVPAPDQDNAVEWLRDFRGEFAAWTGHPDETADQIDVCSYAANICKTAGRTWGGPI